MYRDEFVTCGGVPLKEVREVGITLHMLDINESRHMGMQHCYCVHADTPISITDLAVFLSCSVIM
jgi:hypothetical protein